MLLYVIDVLKFAYSSIGTFNALPSAGTYLIFIVGTGKCTPSEQRNHSNISKYTSKYVLFTYFAYYKNLFKKSTPLIMHSYIV